jgi:hypothetical protein
MHPATIDAPTTSPPPRPTDARPPGRRASQLLFESVLIVCSVLLAFGLNEWRLQRADREMAASILFGFKQEIEANLRLLEEFQPMHASFAEAIAALEPEALAGRTAMEVAMSVRTDRGTVLMSPAEAAWQTAVSTGTLRLLDYETAAILSRIYLLQRDAAGQTALRLTDVVFGPGMFDRGATVQSLQVVMALLGELAAQELSLIGEYRAALRHLEQMGV